MKDARNKTIDPAKRTKKASRETSKARKAAI
jgi:hypothetical protein